MLVLTRRVGEVVMIGNDVVVTVLAVAGRQVRIGIKAPSAVRILRQEIFERVKNEERAGQTCTRDNTEGATKTARCARAETVSSIEPDHNRDRSSLAQQPAQL